MVHKEINYVMENIGNKYCEYKKLMGHLVPSNSNYLLVLRCLVHRFWLSLVCGQKVNAQKEQIESKGNYITKQIT